MTDKAQLNPWRYVMRHIRARPARSGLIVAGVAIAVAFFVLFAAMSAGLSSFIDEELDRPRTTHVYLDSGSPTPFSPDQVGLMELVASNSADGTGVAHWTTPRVQLPVTVTEGGDAVTLWGVRLLPGEDVASPPYDIDARLERGRHLAPGDETVPGAPGRLPVVMGDRAGRLLGSPDGNVTLGPDGTVDPWRMPSANLYPLESKATYVSAPRGPLAAIIVGVLAPGQGHELDWGVFVPLEPLMHLLGQHDPGLDRTYYPQVVVTVEDASRVDIRDLEETLVDTVPGVQGTDDHWDPEEFKASYGGALAALDGWLVIITAVLVVMLVAVTDRKREIATLRAVGIPRRQVSRLVLAEVAVLVSAGLALGLVIGSALALLFGSLHETSGGSGVFLAPTLLDPLVLVTAAVLALCSAGLAAAYPATRAARQRPTEALRYE